MKKKLFIVLVVAFLSTGCTVNYNIVVDKNLKFTEQLNIEEKNSLFDIQYDSPKEGFKSIFDEVNKTLKYKIDDYKITKGLSNTKFSINEKYNSDSEYNNSTILKNINGKVEIYKNTNSKSNTSVFQVMINYDFFDIINTNKYSTIDIDNMNVNITFPYKVVSTNADSVSGNVYTWNLKNNLKSRSFYVEYDDSKTTGVNVRTIIIFVILLLILLAFLFIILFAKKKKKNDL